MKKNSVTTFSLREAAKMTRFPGGEKRFAAWLRQQAYLMPNNEPYQLYCDKQWFILVFRTIYKANPPFSVPVPRITIRGLANLERIVYNKYHKCKPCQ